MESLAKKISEIILSIESSKISAKGAGHKPKNNTAGDPTKADSVILLPLESINSKEVPIFASVE